MPGYLDDTTPAGRLILRVFRLHDSLDRAQVPEELRQGLLFQITRDEAWDLLKTSWGTTGFTLQFISHDFDGGLPDTKRVVVPLESIAEARMPEQGKPWAQICGITLIWLGDMI